MTLLSGRECTDDQSVARCEKYCTSSNQSGFEPSADQGTGPLQASDSDGFTALHHSISEGHGDAALLLLMRGAEFDKEANDGSLALSLAPDAKTRSFIVQAAEREGIDLE